MLQRSNLLLQEADKSARQLPSTRREPSGRLIRTDKSNAPFVKQPSHEMMRDVRDHGQRMEIEGGWMPHEIRSSMRNRLHKHLRGEKVEQPKPVSARAGVEHLLDLAQKSPGSIRTADALQAALPSNGPKRISRRAPPPPIAKRQRRLPSPDSRSEL